MLPAARYRSRVASSVEEPLVLGVRHLMLVDGVGVHVDGVLGLFILVPCEFDRQGSKETDK